MVQFTTLLTAFVASSLALAAPAPVAEAAPAAAAYPSEYAWSVTEFTGGCSRGGCYYNFKVAGPKQDAYPKFSASCSGDERLGYFFAECKDVKGKQNVAVASRFLPKKNKNGVPEQFAISVRYDGAEPGSYFNATGPHKVIYNQVTAPPQSFKVKPTEIIGIA